MIFVDALLQRLAGQPTKRQHIEADIGVTERQH
jgi:hypothetical protein